MAPEMVPGMRDSSGWAEGEAAGIRGGGAGDWASAEKAEARNRQRSAPGKERRARSRREGDPAGGVLNKWVTTPLYTVRRDLQEELEDLEWRKVTCTERQGGNLWRNRGFADELTDSGVIRRGGPGWDPRRRRGGRADSKRAQQFQKAAGRRPRQT